MKKKKYIPKFHRMTITPFVENKLLTVIEKRIMDLRLLNQKRSTIAPAEKDFMDTKLYNLSNDLWREIAVILKIKNP